jgi:probable selenium-dependent hydroxylase accessory protein YqeC
VESNDVQTRLTGALGTTGPQLVAFVGAGGKTTALQRLCEELAARAGGILATTTTAMFARQLTSLGPLLIEDDDETTLATRAGEALGGSGIVTLARAHAADQKVEGLAPAEVDALWTAGVAGSIVVEADGSRGLPLKAFGEAEPQLPMTATTVVVVAGLDALGRPLDEDHVHRAGLLLTLLDAAEGDAVTPRLFAAALALQVARVRALTPRARVVVLLNKAESEHLTARGAAVAAALLTAANDDGGLARSGLPLRIVVGSMRRGVFRVIHG